MRQPARARFRAFPLGLLLLLASAGGTLASPPEDWRLLRPDDLAMLVPVALEADKSRYPPRLPEWLWNDENRLPLLPFEVRQEILTDIALLEAFKEIDRAAADAKQDEIRRTLAGSFTARDLTRDAIVHRNRTEAIFLGTHIDPSFDPAARKTLEAALAVFVQFALDAKVIEEALEQSVPEPAGVPEKYVLDDEGKPVLNEDGTRKIFHRYRFYAQNRTRPRDATAFHAQMREALSGADGDPALLVISRYTGNVWWGGGWYSFFYREPARLARLSRARGYLYISLNSDKLAKGVAHYDDPVFWASKIAHEVLHNLSYWHPSYPDPKQRDEMNPPGKRAFIVAYEQSVYEQAKAARER